MGKNLALLTVAGQLVIRTQFPINLRKVKPSLLDEKLSKELSGGKDND
jgi:hypothetical protein